MRGCDEGRLVRNKKTVSIQGTAQLVKTAGKSSEDRAVPGLYTSHADSLEADSLEKRQP